METIVLTEKSFVEQKIRNVKSQVIDDKPIVAAVSGGVDSALSAVLVEQATGRKPLCLYLDVFTQKGEKERVQKAFDKLGFKLEILNLEELFVKEMQGLTDPEDKRKKFKELYFKSILDYCAKTNAGYLVQGTQARNINIKTYNSRVDFDIPVTVVEPLLGVEKTTIRAVAEQLGLPKELSSKMPFPGPGFSLRISGQITLEKLNLIREITDIVNLHFKDSKYFQVFPYLMSEKAVGIRNGQRVDGNVITLRVVDTRDNLNYFVPEIERTKLDNLVSEIINEFPQVTRVLLDLTPKPPGSVEYQ